MAAQTAQISNTIPSSSTSLEIHIPDDVHHSFALMMEESEVSKINRGKHIPRVPSNLREGEFNKDCFDPVALSLGPYHQGKRHLQRMENYKIEAIKRFTGDTNLSGKAATFYMQLESVMVEARECYEDKKNLSHADFWMMMFKDSCFILNFMDEYEEKVVRRLTDSKYIFELRAVVRRSYHREALLIENPLLSDYEDAIVLRDMLLLENQVPFIVLNRLLSIKHGSEFTSVTKHVDTFLKIITRKSFIYSVGFKLEAQVEPVHLLDLFRKQILGKEEYPLPQVYYHDQLFSTPKSVTNLKDAGITCANSKLSLTNIDFGKGFGKHRFQKLLRVPKVTVYNDSKCLFLNMIAFEKSGYGPSDNGIISYICFMNKLINREEDVKNLRDGYILNNYLATDNHVVDLFNGLSKDLVSDLCMYNEARMRMIDYFENRWTKIRVKCVVSLRELYQTYFSSPWAMVGFIAAVLILFLTAVQTYFAAFSKGKKK